MTSPRQLAYRDRFVWELEQVVSAQFDDCNDFSDRFVFPDMDTKVALVIQLSQREWTTLYSAILTGADLAYPNNSHDIENLFLQTVMCPLTQFCAAMIECLQNDPDTLAALLQLLAENGVTGGVGDPSAPLAEEITGQNLLPAGYVCTDNKAFGMALAVVNSINEATIEVLQAIEILTNPVEIAAELGDNVPGVGVLSSAGDVARWIQDAATEAYELAWSDVTRDELACLLWCEFKGSCFLSFDSIWNVYMGASGVAPPPGVLLTDWLAWLIALPFTAALTTVATVSLLGLLAMRYGGSFGDFELGIRSMETVINLAQDDSSGDWAIVCDACGPWCFEFDFTLSDGGWSVAAGWHTGGTRGVYVPGVGWQSDIVVVDEFESSIVSPFINFGDAATITEFSIDYTGANAGTWVHGLILSSIWYTTDLIGRISLKTYEPATPPGNVKWTGSVLAKGIAFSNWNSWTTPGNTIGAQQIVKVTVKGTGSNPFGASNC